MPRVDLKVLEQNLRTQSHIAVEAVRLLNQLYMRQMVIHDVYCSKNLYDSPCGCTYTMAQGFLDNILDPSRLCHYCGNRFTKDEESVVIDENNWHKDCMDKEIAKRKSVG